MAKVVKVKDLAELNLDEVNLFHIQESYQRQITHAKPLTAQKKNISMVSGTTAKWFRQKGTGRARQGERKNPHMTGGALAFPPHYRTPKKGLNKQVRISALRSAVLAHVQGGSAYCIQGKEFEGIEKTRDVASVLGSIEGTGDICLVLGRGTKAWRSSRNLPMVRLVTPGQLNVRDLVDSETLVFTKAALDEYKELLKVKNIPVEEFEEPEAQAEPAVEAAEPADAKAVKAPEADANGAEEGEE